MHDEKNKKFYINTPNGEAVILYDFQDGNIVAYHTFVPLPERGKGIASRLAEELFLFAKNNNLKVVPKCPFVREFSKRNQEYRNLIA